MGIDFSAPEGLGRLVTPAEKKKCGCGRRYGPHEWVALRLVGYCGAASGDARQVLEMRNCVCGSTLAVDVPVEALAQCVAKGRLARWFTTFVLVGETR